MKSEIKQRIEQIKNGQVPEGYKKTKIGIVPTEWENVHFGDLFITKNEYTEDLDKYPLYSLTIEDGITAKSERYERSHLVKKENAYKVVEPNDFAYNPMNVRFGAVARHKENTTVCVSGYYDIFTAKEKTDLKFMDSFLVSDMMIKYYNKVSTGSLVEKQRVHYSEFIEFNLPLPSKKERAKIAEILSTQDKLIELYQRKIDELHKLKKIYLSKMFPQKGKNVPEWRFPQFTDAWEQRKLGDVFEEYSEKNHGELPALMIIQGGGTIRRDESDRSLLYDRSNLSNYKMVNEGDFIVHLRSFEGGLELATNTGIISPAYHTFHGENTDSRFYYSYFRSKKFIDTDLKPHVYGIRDGRSIDIDGMKTIKIPYISYEEQTAIGTYIEQFDNLITLHQRKLEEMKKQKKALMQLLLTGIVRVKR